MKTMIRIYFIFLLSCAVFNLTGQANSRPDKEEKVYLFSDRNLYVTGESIFFSAYIQSSPDEKSSRILYCDLITSDGTRMAGGKYIIENFASEGSLAIPGDILTGDYYLRSYTRYMRNIGPSGYSYTLIKIVNPSRKDVQVSSDQPSGINEEEKTAEKGIIFRISPGKPVYTHNDSIIIAIDGTGKSGGNSYKILSLSVIPEYSLIGKNITFPQTSVKDNQTYYTENLGLSLTGKLVDNRSGKPLPETRINLSLIGEGRDFMTMKTDSTGGFYFSLPDYTGSRDLFLCSQSIPGNEPQLLVDNDFCSLPVHIPSGIFTLNSEQREAAYKMAINLQVKSYFISDSARKKDDLPGQVFYGLPNEVLYIDKYVQLPTLEEYFNSLTSMVRIRKRQEGKYVKIIGPQTELSEFAPLVMVDLVAVEDLSSVLSIVPSEISRIEIVNSLYVKGDQTYGGIINIISKHSDFAGINLPQSGIFINYGFLVPPGEAEYRLQGAPDTRNTLYWEPRLKLDKNNSAKIQFPSPDTPGRYIVVLSGINDKGEAFRQTAEFRVEK